MKKTDILKDLARKYPKGPTGKIRRSAYFCRQEYSEVYEKYMDVWALRSNSKNKWGGYDARTIWEKFGENPKFYEIREEAVQAYDKHRVSHRSISLRAKRAYQKIKFAVDDIKRSGRTGVWTVQWSYKKSMYIWASGHEDAIARSYVFSGVIDRDSSFYSEPRVKFYDFGDPKKARDLNISAFEKESLKHDQDLKYVKERLEELTMKKKEFEENTSVILSMIESQFEDSIEND